MTSWTRPDDERPVRPLGMEGGVAAEGGSECGDDQALEFEGVLEAEAGRRNVVKVQDPLLPSEEEVMRHELTHLPYRSWCSHCVREKGRAIDHRKQNRDPKIPELHVDYCFLGSAADARPWCILVAMQFGTKCLLAAEGCQPRVPGEADVRLPEGIGFGALRRCS